MKGRVLCKTDHAYKYYGKRGIKIDKNWIDFSGFKKDMYAAYLIHLKEYGERNTTLDRIDSNGDYTLKNCRWATFQEQSENKTTSRLFKFKGKMRTLKEISNMTGLSYGTVYGRYTHRYTKVKQQTVVLGKLTPTQTPATL